MLQAKLEIKAVNAPVLNEPLSVVVLMTVAKVGSVPHAKPRMVGFVPPVVTIVPFRVAVLALAEAD